MDAPRVSEMRLVVTAPDYEEALRFYRDVLGLPEAGATVVAEPTRTPWASLNARLEAPAGLQLTLFTDDPA